MITSHLAQGQDTTNNKLQQHRIIPVLGYQPETHLVFGLNLKSIIAKDTSLFSKVSTMDNLVYFTQRKQLVLRNKLELYTKNNWFWEANTRYQYYPYSYFGIGNTTSQTNEEVILNERLRATGRIEKRRSENHYLGGIYFFSFERFTSSSSHQLFKKEQADEAKKAFWFGLGPSYTIDKRDHNLYPSKGFFYSFQNVTLTNFSGKTISNFSADYRWFTELWNDKNLLAFQFKASQLIGEAPFYLLNNLSGENRLRAYHENRFIDKFSTYVQVEGRKHFYKRWKLAGFVGTGYVSSSIAEVGALHGAIGGGMRYELIKNSKMNLRGDLTLNDEGQIKMYIGLNEAF